MRASGVLMPIFSLPSNHGIGTLGKKAYEFVDFLKKAGQSYWQVLPLNPTNYGYSPYQSFQYYEGNPYFVDLDVLADEGLLDLNDFILVDFGDDDFSIDYGKLYENRFTVLKKAFERFDKTSDDYVKFCKKEKHWLEDYALFMAIKDSLGGISWHDWDDALKYRKKSALKAFKEEHIDELEFYKFIQFEFFKQWYALKSYANKNGIKIIGDIPIYVADDSVDIWCNTKEFDLDENLLPNVVAGCPPDAFSADGQLWGMPVYNWEYMKNEPNPYSWWRARVRHVLRVYDIVRIDHFRGFESFYCINYGAKNARRGKWRKGPGIDLFNSFKRDFGEDLPIIAEDLGFLTKEVYDLLDETGFPGMKVLQFAFDPDGGGSEYLPHNHKRNCVVYVGTHDNDTALGWTKTAERECVDYARKYIHVDEKEGWSWAMIRTAMMSQADTAIIMMQDFICLGSEGRINTPSTLGDNWKWRIDGYCINDWLAEMIYKNTKVYERLPKNKKKSVQK